MKTNYFKMVCLLCTSFLFAQNNDFNNQGGDLLWSNPLNWSLGAVPTTANAEAVRLPLLLESNVDADFTIKKIQNIFGVLGNATVGGSGSITLNPGVLNAYAIENVSNNNVNLSFRGNLVLNNSAGFSRIRNLNGTSNAIEFRDTSVLTLTTPLEIFTGSSNDFRFNGTLAGGANLRLAANSAVTFGGTSSNPNYTGEIVFLINSVLTVNTADDNIFYSGPKIQINGTNASIVLNGANVFASNIVIGGSSAFTFTANKNQNDLRAITISANGTLNLVVGSEVTNLTFDDNSEFPWNAGTVNITGFQNGIIRFGTNNEGLTTEQLAQIVADNGGEALALDSNGFLVEASTLSINDFQSEKANPIIKSTFVKNQIQFNAPQNSVQIIDMSGRVLLNSNAVNQNELSVDFLQTGQYIAVFGDKIVERFIKK
jgi:hypothetical protein